jgi:flagellar hook-associated protein 3 FlgL
MVSPFISTQALNNGTRLNILKLQNRLLTAQQEVASGRHADVGVTLGGRTSETVSLRQQQARFTTIIQTNSVVTTRLDVSETTLEGYANSAQGFVSTLLASRDTENGPTVSQGEARAALVSLIDGLNGTVGGEYLFGGINNSAQPVADYYSTPTSASRQSVIDAFTTGFGTPPSDPANNGISAAAMQSFIDGPYADLFGDPAWGANWSNASDQKLNSRISTFEQIDTSASANQSPFRKLARAYTMIADLGVDTLNRETFGVVVDSAVKLASEAIQELSGVRSNLGTAAARVAASNQRMTAQISVLPPRSTILKRSTRSRPRRG